MPKQQWDVFLGVRSSSIRLSYDEHFLGAAELNYRNIWYSKMISPPNIIYPPFCVMLIEGDLGVGCLVTVKRVILCCIGETKCEFVIELCFAALNNDIIFSSSLCLCPRMD